MEPAVEVEMGTVLNDLRYAMRQLAKSPGFAVIAIVTLALGIGANTAIFSVVNAVLLNPMPYPQPDRIVVLFHHKHNFLRGSISYPNFLDWQRENQSFSSVAAYREMGGVTLTGNGEPEVANGEMISAGLFEILGVKPVLGRTFTADEDRLGANPTVMISEGLWKRKFGSDPHVRQWGLAQDTVESMRAQVYESLMQAPDDLMMMLAQGSHVYLRTATGVDPASVFPAVRKKLSQVRGQIVAFEPELMERIVAESIARQRFTMILFTGFAVVALLLASVGIYGVLSYVVGQRTQEIGIRMALGAQRGDVLRSILRDGARMTLIGIAAGGVAAFALARLMSSMLFGVKPTDPLTFGGVALLLCVIALLACYIPARRAASVDPMQALRSE